MKKKQIEKIHVLRLTDNEFAANYEALIGYKDHLLHLLANHKQSKILEIECKRALKEVHAILSKYFR